MFGNKERPYLRLVESPPIPEISEEELEEERRKYFELYLLTNISSETDQPIEEEAVNFLRRFSSLQSRFGDDRSIDTLEAWIVQGANLESLLQISQGQLQRVIQQCQSLPRETDEEERDRAQLYVFRWNRIRVVIQIVLDPKPHNGELANVVSLKASSS